MIDLLGLLIKKYLKEKGIKQKFVANKAGIAENILSTMLSNKRGISAEEYFKICSALDVGTNLFADEWRLQNTA